MSGRLRITDSTAPHVKDERAALILDNLKQIRFNDTRKFGRWTERNSLLSPVPKTLIFYSPLSEIYYWENSLI